MRLVNRFRSCVTRYVLLFAPLFFWSTFSQAQQILIGDAAAGRIVREPVATPGLKDTLIGGIPSVYAIAADDTGRYVYWTDIVTPAIHAFDAVTLTDTVIVSTGLSIPRGIALDEQAGRLYWTDNGTGTLQSCWLDGSHVRTLLTSLHSPGCVALDRLHSVLYCIDNGDSAKRIIRCDTAGNNAIAVVPGLAQAKGIAIDPLHNFLYWIDAGTGKLRQANFLSASPLPATDVISLAGTSRGLVVDELDRRVYWTDIGTRGIYTMSLDTLTAHLLDSSSFIAPLGLTLTWSAMPVAVLSKFTATRGGDSVSLAWTTASEYRSLGFVVERRDSATWDSLGYLPGQGTTTEQHNYAFVDHAVPNKDTLSYRLREMNISGVLAYSGIVEAIKGGPTGVADNGGELPASFGLAQNWPNPFNPSTTIAYNIAEGRQYGVSSKQKDGAGVQVKLVVYDLLGREVAVLVDGYQTAGVHHVVFDARSLASGMYVYRLTAGGLTFSRRMVLLR